MRSTRLNVLNLSNPSIRTLHLSWVAFFVTFLVWFSHAPLMAFIKEAFDLSSQEIKALLILNVALTIPARIVMGVLVDKFGPRRIYAGLLMTSAFFCWGIAEGIYGGWGNFGSAAAAMTLPTLALFIGGEDGWRYAMSCMGVIAFLYSIFFYSRAQNTPKGSTYFKPKRSGRLEVSSKADLYLLLAMNVPMYGALAVLTWKLSPGNLSLLTDRAASAIYLGLVLLFFFQTSQILRVNKEHLAAGVPAIEKYKFKQVAVLNWAYFVTFGSELAVVSMLPLFFMDTFELSAVQAGLMAWL